MKRITACLLSVALFLAAGCLIAAADIPKQINIQGRVPVPVTLSELNFEVLDVNKNLIATSKKSATVNNDGTFNYELDFSDKNLFNPAMTFNFNQQYLIRVKDKASNKEVATQPLNSVPYAFSAIAAEANVLKTGDTMTGPLLVNSSDSAVVGTSDYVGVTGISYKESNNVTYGYVGVIGKGVTAGGSFESTSGIGVYGKGKTMGGAFVSDSVGVLGKGSSTGGAFESTMGYGVHSTAPKNYFSGDVRIGTTEIGSLTLALRSSGTGFYGSDKQLNGWCGGEIAFGFKSDGSSYINGGSPNAKVISIDTDGEVGIGTSKPEMVLDVKDDTARARLIGDYLKVFTNAAKTPGIWFSSNDLGGNITNRSFVGIADNKFNSVGFYGASGANWGLVMDNATGNVGIGTSSPNEKLEVNGTTLIGKSTKGIKLFTYGTGVDIASSGDYPLAINYQSGQNTLLNTTSGNVLIGTSLSKAKLAVVGTASDNNVNGYDYHLKYAGVDWADSDYAGPVPLSIYASNAIGAAQYDCFSDMRIKRILMRPNGDESLKLLNRLVVTDFKYVDTINQGKVQKKGFIAQEVEKVLPQAVSKTTDFIPNIYKKSQDVVFNAEAKTLKISMNEVPDIKVGDKVRLISKNGDDQREVVEVDGTSFVVKGWDKEVKDIFVFGKQVSDFRSLDYDQVFSLGVSAIQELSKQVKALKTENDDLKKRITALEKR